MKVIVSIEQDEKPNTVEQFYKILNLVFKFDLQDNPNGTPLTEGDHIAARRLSRAFPIMCVMSFLESCSPVDFCADLRDQFIEAMGESKLNPQLLNGSYVRIYQNCSEILASNNNEQDIRSIIESIGSVHKVNLKSVERPYSENELDKMINCLKRELLS